MSVTISSPQEICQSPLNLSMTKQLYSFPRASRFEKLENPSYCKAAFYNHSDQLSHRATTLGYGQKYDISKQVNKTPAPNVYNIKGEFDLAHDKHKGFQFGVSRENMTQQSIFGQISEYPGPGKYDAKTQLSDIKYTMRAKTGVDPLIFNAYVPGPGSYTVLPALTPKGVYNVSKFKNSGACIINPKTKRFPDTYSNFVPGPGQYSHQNLNLQKVFNKIQQYYIYIQSGQYVINGFTSSPSRSFPHEKREDIIKGIEQTPGPGTYRLPSEFGHYQSSKKDPISKPVE